MTVSWEKKHLSEIFELVTKIILFLIKDSMYT